MRIAVAGGTGVVGRCVVEEAAAAGDDVVVLARSVGIDTASGEGLAAALRGVDAVVDVTNAGTTEPQPATEFFVESTANLQRLGAAAGVAHLVTLSIVGIDRAPTGYYAAKLAHEAAARSGGLPATVVRATQFHEFPAQMIRRHRRGARAAVPDLVVQTVAARAVARVLLDVAGAPPAPRTLDVAGPVRADLVALARRFATYVGAGVEIVPAPTTVPAGALLAGEGARIVGPTFDEWLAGEDAALLARLR